MTVLLSDFYRETRITIPQNNDVVLTFTVMNPNNNNAPQDLTGCTLTFYRKPTRYTTDSDPAVKTYNGTVAQDPTTGDVSFSIPAADNAVAAGVWWRIDVLQSSQRRTAGFGPLEVEAV